jgi:hypothetical protein
MGEEKSVQSMAALPATKKQLFQPMGAERNVTVSDINPSEVADQAAGIVQARALQRKRAMTTAAATMLADVMELLRENPQHPIAVTAAAILSRQATAEDIVTALRAAYGADFDQALAARPTPPAIPGTAEERYPIIEADGSENGSVPVNDPTRRHELEGQGYRLTKDGTRWVYKKQGTPPADSHTRVQDPPAGPTPPRAGDFPLYDKGNRHQEGWVSPADAARRAQQGELVPITGPDRTTVIGYRYAKFFERR